MRAKMRNKITILLILIVIALLFLVYMVSERYGKRRVKSPAPSPKPPIQVKISKTEAISLAKQAAAKEGYKVDEHNFIRINEVTLRRGPCWVITFEPKRPGDYLGGVQSIEVGVHKETGEIKMYVSTQVKISKTEAISLAKEAAVKAGYKVDEYNFQVDQDFLRGRPCWAIMFELKRPVDYLGGGQLFSVLVDWESGAIKMYGRVQVKISKTQAVSLAKEAAVKAGYRVEGYNFQVDQNFLGGRPCWFIDFELKHPVYHIGGRQHFAVSVDKETGETEVFGGR
jgi:hypothetical protein